jgi:hypothetical protein
VYRPNHEVFVATAADEEDHEATIRLRAAAGEHERAQPGSRRLEGGES